MAHIGPARPGTRYSYIKYGCRCTPCVMAKRRGSFNTCECGERKSRSSQLCQACATIRDRARYTGRPATRKVAAPSPETPVSHDAVYWRLRALDAEATAALVQRENARLLHEMTQRPKVPA